MSFWDNVFAGPGPQQGRQPISPPLTLGQSSAWWRDDPQVTGTPMSPPVATQYGQPAQQHYTAQDLQKIRKRGHQNISVEEAEEIAEYDLATKEKFQNRCPECDSGNFIPAGTRVKVPGVNIMPTDKCFDCGYSARGPERVVGASGGGKASIHTRQIDTGGAGGQSMFGRFNGIPASYAPRA